MRSDMLVMQQVGALWASAGALCASAGALHTWNVASSSDSGLRSVSMSYFIFTTVTWSKLRHRFMEASPRFSSGICCRERNYWGWRRHWRTDEDAGKAEGGTVGHGHLFLELQ